MECSKCGAETYRNTAEMWNNEGKAIEIEVWYCGICGHIEGVKK